jgi:hypothetical protein
MYTPQIALHSTLENTKLCVYTYFWGRKNGKKGWIDIKKIRVSLMKNYILYITIYVSKIK